MNIIGIDPGGSGGIAWSIGNVAPVATAKMPETPHDLVEILGTIAAEGTCEVHLEEVGGYIGGVGSPGSKMFNFGRNFGQIIGVCAALKLPLKLVKPKRWQKALGLGTSKGMSKTEWKNKLKARAQQLYPDIKITLDVADAVLIYHAAKEGLL